MTEPTMTDRLAIVIENVLFSPGNVRTLDCAPGLPAKIAKAIMAKLAVAGFVIAPVKPTKAMCNALDRSNQYDHATATVGYAKMLAAAQKE